MFLHVSVCPQGGVHGVRGRGWAWQGGRVWWGVCMAWEACVVGGVHGRGVWHGGGHAWWGACVVGACVVVGDGGMHAPLADTMGYGQRVGGTHPTGMHSCLNMN